MRYLLLILLFVLWANPAHALKVIETKSKGGIAAWLVEDHTMPIISLRFAFKGGVELDPVDKQGLAAIATTLMQRGAGEWDETVFQKTLADNNIEFGLDASRDATFGSLYLLREDRTLAARMANAALTQPRFDPAVVARGKSEQLVAIQQRFADPDWQARRAMFYQLFEGHPYALRSYGKAETVAAITVEDLKTYVKTTFARDRLMVTAVGDITADELGAWLDEIFKGLPEHTDIKSVPPMQPKLDGKVSFVEREGTQSIAMLAAPGLDEHDPDWFAAMTLNYVLGAGDFSSRLMKEVRDKRGLTYGIGTSLNTMEAADLMIGQASMDNPKTIEALATVREVWKGLYDNGVTVDELKEAQDYLTGSLPLAYATTRSTASTLMGVMRDGFRPDYLDKRNALIRAVTLDDVKRVAKRLLDPALLTVVVVGDPSGLKPDRTLPWVED